MTLVTAIRVQSVLMKSKIGRVLFGGEDKVEVIQWPAQRHAHKNTTFCLESQAVALAALGLIYRTFVALDIYRGSRAMNFMQTPLKHSMLRA